MKLISDSVKEKMIWDKVYEKLGFHPSCSYRGHSMDVKLPFEIKETYAVYAVDEMTTTEIDYLQNNMNRIFASVLCKGKYMYALDWQHSSFIFNPAEPEEQKNLWIEDRNYSGGGYYAYFPSFYPNGDYYFFIEEDFAFGFLGHPWRQEVWIFGDTLVKKTEEIYDSFGWKRLV